MFKLLCAALLLTVAACGGGSSAPTPTTPAPIPAADACNLIGGIGSTSGLPILNGAVCSADRSSVVLLNIRGGDEGGACSGTVITRRAILTAAHCLDKGATSVQVWLGSGDQIPAQSFEHYPGYVFNTTNTYDVGVVIVGQDLPRVSIPLLTSRDARVGEAAVIAGWGRDQSDIPATLRAGSTSLTAVGSLLQTPYAPPASSICSGDSGGPILVSEGGTWAVAGISSATSGSVCNTGTNYYQAIRHPSVIGFIRQHVSGFPER